MEGLLKRELRFELSAQKPRACQQESAVPVAAASVKAIGPVLLCASSVLQSLLLAW